MKRLFLYEWLLSRTPGEYTKVRSFGYHVFDAWAVKRTRPGALLTICVGEEPQFCYNEQWHRGARGTATLYLRWDEHDYHHEGVWEAFWFHFDPSRGLLEVLRRHSLTPGPHRLSEEDLAGLERVFAHGELRPELAYHRAAVELEGEAARRNSQTAPNAQP